MTTKIHLIIICTAFAVLSASCENEIPFNPGKQEPQLIMNALLNAGSTENYVVLHLSDGRDIDRLNEATLTLYVNGRMEETPPPMTPEEIAGKPEDGTEPDYDHVIMQKFRLTTALHPGDVIRLEATGENGKYHASCEVTVPQPVEGLKVDTCLAYLRRYNYQELHRQYKVTLQDRPDERNFYRLEILNDFKFRCQYREYAYDENGDLIPNENGYDWVYTTKEITVFDRKDEIVNHEDVILTDGHPTNPEDEENELFPSIENKYNIFTDNRFRNTSATLTVYTPHYNDYRPTYSDYNRIYRTHTISIRLLTLTEDEYRYLKALNCLDDDDYDNALMEPVSLPSNVKGGMGFVGVCAETKLTMEFPESLIWGWEGPA